MIYTAKQLSVQPIVCYGESGETRRSICFYACSFCILCIYSLRFYNFIHFMTSRLNLSLFLFLKIAYSLHVGYIFFRIFFYLFVR